MQTMTHREASGLRVLWIARVPRAVFSVALLLILGLGALLPGAGVQPTVRAAGPTDIVGPAGSGAFGTQVTALPNGNLVITDPSYDLPDGTEDVGAIYLYNGRTGALISALTGSHPTDEVGNDRVTVLTNGNYVVCSRHWHNGTIGYAGAVTWGSGMTGVTGTVSAANSLVGSHAYDLVGGWVVTALSNGHYVVSSPEWDSGTAGDAGAVTWGDGTRGIAGTISAANSLVGSHAGDGIGHWEVTVLSNSNYVVSSPSWDSGTAADAGAVTWGDGTRGVRGTVSAANSLVGSHSSDGIGEVTALTNGSYVVSSPYWDNGTVADAGAVTWASGTTGITGTVSAANSLVGRQAGDRVGYSYGGVAALTNGHYVVRSPFWDNGTAADAGAVTWGSGMMGITGTVSVANSLVGSQAGDLVSYDGDVMGPAVVALPNGHYVVRSPFWDNGPVADAGAVTWGDGTRAARGTVSAANSLVGSQANDRVGFGGVRALRKGHYVALSPLWDNGTVADAGAASWGDGMRGVAGSVSAANSLVGSQAHNQVGSDVVALTTGHYVVLSRFWDNGTAAGAGAVTWGDGARGITGTVSAANSLVGSHAGDMSGWMVTALTNGHYVVSSPYWDDGAAADAGAVTWSDGTMGLTGAVLAANSLVGTQAYDRVGYHGVTALTNGSYVVSSPYWSSGTVAYAGAVTWGDGTRGARGTVSAANSLVGSQAEDHVGYGGVTALPNGSYVVSSPYWDNGTVVEAGAVTWGSGRAGITGTVSAANSVLGTASDGHWLQNYAYDYANWQLVVGRPADNTVTLWPIATNQRSFFLPLISRAYVGGAG